MSHNPSIDELLVVSAMLAADHTDASIADVEFYNLPIEWEMEFNPDENGEIQALRSVSLSVSEAKRQRKS